MTKHETGVEAVTKVLLLEAHKLSARELAESAISAYLKAINAEPVAWRYNIGGDFWDVTDIESQANRRRELGQDVIPLYAAPLPSPGNAERDTPAPLSQMVAVKPITLEVLRDYFRAMDAGDVPDQALALYSYLLMDGFISKASASEEVRAALSTATPEKQP